MQIWSAEIKELETLYTSIKSRFPELERELEKLIKFDDANVILLYSRRCLEVIITDLCEIELKRPRKTEPLKGIIDKLSHEEKVPSHIITSMQNLNSLSTYGAHPKEFEPEQVKPVLNNLTTIIKWYLKYKDTQVTDKVKSKGVTDETKAPVDSTKQIQQPKKKLILLISGLALVVVIIVVALFVFDIIGGKQTKELEKSIAVLPFKNDSPDQERMYFINGTMEAILDNLCKIKDLRVPGRTSVEQYRDNPIPSRTIAGELNVNYVLEGSGHRDGNNVRLHIQLLDAWKDKHLWSKTYDADIEDIFSMQSEIAKLVAEEIEAIITPEEKQLIEKIPTANLTAYDFYQRGREESRNNRLVLISMGWVSDNENKKALEKAEYFYQKALEYDSTFAQAYAGLAWLYYEKQYWATFLSESFLDSVLILADMALKYDPQLSDAHSIKGQYYRQIGNPEKAIREFEEAIKFNPNDWMAYYHEGSLYWRPLENYTKSIEYFHEAVIRNRGENLSDLLFYLHSAYLEAGFIDKAKYYMKEALSLDLDSGKYYGGLAGVEFCAENFEKSAEYLNKQIEIDSTDFNHFPYHTYAGKHREAYVYYSKLVNYFNRSGALTLQSSHRIGYAYWKMGKYKKAEEYFDKQIKYSTEAIKLGRDIAIRKAAHYDLAGVFCFLGDKEKAYQYLNEVDKKDRYPLWWVILAKYDPLFENIRSEERFQKILQNMEAKYQAEHERVRKWLEENDLPG